MNRHLESITSSIQKLANVSLVNFTKDQPENCFSFVIKSDEFFIPASENINKEEEIAKLEEELKYTKGFLASVDKKLSNERFVNNAPEAVVNTEKKKRADAEAKIAAIEESLKSLA